MEGLLIEKAYRDPLSHYVEDMNFKLYEPDIRLIPIAPLHWHPEYEWIFVLYGGLGVDINGIPYTLKKEQGLLINQKNIHSIYKTDNKDCRFYTFLFGEHFLFPDMADPVYKKYILPQHEFHRAPPTLISGHTPWEQEIITGLKEIHRLYQEKKEGFELRIRILLLSFFYQFIKEKCYTRESTKIDVHMASVRAALTIIHRHYAEDIQISDLTNEMAMCPDHFRKIFKSITGKSPLEYLLNYRLERAEQLLLDEDDKISNIAAKAGFNDSNYFTRLFKKKRGMTPNKFRKEYKSS
jgi:AraC-like DNA-binding protein